MAENIPYYPSYISSAPSTPKKIGKVSNSLASSPLQDMTNIDHRLVRSEQVSKAFAIRRTKTTNASAKSQMPSWYLFCTTLAVVRQMQIKYNHEKKRMLETWLTQKQEFESKRDADEGKIGSLKAEKQFLKLQLAKSEELRKHADASNLAQQAALRQEIDKITQQSAQLLKERNETKELLHSAETGELSERAMRLEMIRHHQEEMQLLAKHHARELDDLRSQIDSLRQEISERDITVQNLEQKVSQLSHEGFVAVRAHTPAGFYFADYDLTAAFDKLKQEHLFSYLPIEVRRELGLAFADLPIGQQQEEEQETTEDEVKARRGFFAWLFSRQ